MDLGGGAATLFTTPYPGPENYDWTLFALRKVRDRRFIGGPPAKRLYYSHFNNKVRPDRCLFYWEPILYYVDLWSRSWSSLYRVIFAALYYL